MKKKLAFDRANNIVIFRVKCVKIAFKTFNPEDGWFILAKYFIEMSPR